MMIDYSGQQIGSYRLQRRLGFGGFASVYLGQHVRIATKQAAIKLLHMLDVDSKKFQQEAETIAALDHPSIIHLIDFDFHDQMPFLVIDYAPGGSLRARHPEGTQVPLSAVVEYVQEIAKALEYAHGKNFIHRDIKPDNILIGGRGELRLGDFGIAILSQTGRTSLTPSSGIGGTAYYMAPEQSRGKPEKASDQYALGIMVYEWLCGKPPFTEGNAINIQYQHAFEPVPSLCEQLPTLLPTVEQVIMRALAKDPKDRFANVQEFAIALAQASSPPQIASLLKSNPRYKDSHFMGANIMEERCPKCGTWLATDENGGKYCQVPDCPNYQQQVVPPPLNAPRSTGPLPPSSQQSPQYTPSSPTPTGPLPPSSQQSPQYTPSSPTPADSTGNLAGQFQKLGKIIHQYPGARALNSFNPLQKLHCPYCNAVFHPSDCAIYSTTKFNQANESILLRAAPKGAFMRFFARLRIQRLDGPMYTEHRACRSCPRCQKFLPYGFEIDPSFNIALVGNNISGKTHYLAALLHQLKNGELAQGGDVYVNFTPLNKEAEQKFYEYDQRLFKERKGLDNTPRYTQPIHQNKVAMMEPLIFRLEIGYQEQRQPIRNVMNLVFYDISGEDISKPNVMSQFLWPISEAQGIIYVADPLQMENIVAGILAEQPSNQQAQNVQKILGGMLKVHEVLDNIIQVFMRYNKLSSRNSVTTPIAIMLSKSDVLDTIAQKHHFQDAIFLKNGTYYGTTDPGDIATVNKDVQLLLRQFKEQRLIHASLRFLHVSFFATSATGCAPSDTGKYLEYKEVKPRRCLDPLIWLLWKLSPSNSSLYR